MKPILPTAATATWQQTRNSRTNVPGSIWAKPPALARTVPTQWPLVPSAAVTADWAPAEHQHSVHGKQLTLCAIPTAHLFVPKGPQPPPLACAPVVRTATTIFREAFYTRHVSKQINKWEWVMHPGLTGWHVWQLHSGSAWRNRLKE